VAVSRRDFLKGAGGAAALAVAGGAVGVDRLLAAGDGKHATRSHSRLGRHPHLYRSEPDLRPPAIAVAAVESRRTAEAGYLMLGPGSLGRIQGGPLMVNERGQPLWFKSLPWPRWPTNFTSAEYGGGPVLAWWEGEVQLPAGYGRGEGVIVDAAYNEVTRVRATGGRVADMHEFRLTPDGTVLMACFPQTVPADLSAVGGPKNGRVLESVFQEVDIATGRLVMEWRSLDHVPITESSRHLTDPYDYFHINTIDIAPDGHLIISARHTSTLYKLDRRTGEIIWRLGGKRSDFAMTREARFAWQHDGRQIDARTFTVFDNGYDGTARTHSESRGIVLDVDEPGRNVRLAGAYYHPKTILVEAMGSVQILPSGNVLVGWGSAPFITEHKRTGAVVWSARMPKGEQTYRAYRVPWSGSPAGAPAIAAGRDEVTGQAVLYVSWNGATAVHAWQVHSGPAPTRLRPAAVARRRGFETAIRLERDAAYAAVVALDHRARPLGMTPTIRV
jgi:hypothetical protein